ncbi:MAG: phosphatidate cytidylyltransferase [Phycisphaerales bacterium]|nr:phosphatidate cytidylyltransferase [Phycisphaerales bacterium]
MLRARLITGFLLVGGLLTLFAFDQRIGSVQWCCGSLPQGLLLAALGMIAAPLAAIEFGSLCRGVHERCSMPVLLLSIEAWILLYFMLPESTPASRVLGLVGTLVISSMAISILVLSRGRDLRGVLAGSGLTVGVAAYLAIGLGMLLLIRREHAVWWVAGIIAIVKMCDTGAFFVGCNFGRHKLIPWISPGKTWEGLAGGLLTAVGTAVLLAFASERWLPMEPVIPIGAAVLLGLLFGFAGQCGDLVMSVFKRDSGLKDTSSVLPGLGGVLDVFDSLLLVAPLAYWLLPTSS